MPDPGQLVERVARRLGMALRLAGLEREQAEEAQREAAARLARAERDAAERPQRAARTREAALRAIDEQWSGRLASLAGQVRDAADREATGAATAGWDAFRATPVHRSTPLPPVRIGTTTDDLPVLVPFADHG